MEKPEVPEHFMYLREDDLKKADAVAWAVVDTTSDPVKYPFVFPQMEANEVRIKITHTGLCQSDSLHTRKQWSPHITYPCVPGHEVVGLVTMVGKDVKNLKVGDRVGCGPQRDCCHGCDRCKQGNTNLCTKNWTGLYDPFFGGYCTHIQLPQSHTFLIPPNLPSDVTPPLLCAGVTVYAPLVRVARAGLKCAVVGIGGLGHLAVMYANQLGMKVTAFTTSFNRETEMKEMGAINLSHSTDLESLAKEIGKYDIVINTLYVSDPKVFMAHQRLTQKNGTYIQVGSPPADTPFLFDHMYLVCNQINVQGSIIGSVQETNDMLRFSADHQIYPICEFFNYQDFPKAFAHLEKGKPHFRCVVNVTDWAKKNGFDK